MTLSITAMSKINGVMIREIKWKIGQDIGDVEWFEEDFSPARVYLKIRANGEELALIENKFRTYNYQDNSITYSIPMPKCKDGESVVWFGDIAATILWNVLSLS